MVTGVDSGIRDINGWTAIETPQTAAAANSMTAMVPVETAGVNLERVPDKDGYERSGPVPAQPETVIVEKNKGFFNKIKHLFTGRDYYTTSQGVTLSTDRNTGFVTETSDGRVFIDGAQNAKIKGSKQNDTIYVSGSSVKSIDGKKGDDNIYIENSDVKTIKGGRGNDILEVNNCYVKKIKGGTGDDVIIASNSNVKNINGQWGKDEVYTDGGHVEVTSSIRDNVEIHNNPLNPNPDTNYAFH